MIFTASEITKLAIMLYESGNNYMTYSKRVEIKKEIKNLANTTHFAARNDDEPEKTFVNILKECFDNSVDNIKTAASYYLIKAVGYFIRSKEKTLRETEQKTEEFISGAVV